MMSILGKVLGILMKLCYNMTKNYGLAIILFTLLTKVILFPVSILMQKNSIKMVKMTPALNRIKAKYFGDNDTIAEEESKLYKKEKYNPLLSLIPLIIQLVLLMGVIEVIYHPLDYIINVPKDTVNNYVEVVQRHNPDINIESSSLQLDIVEDIKHNDADYLSKTNDKSIIENIKNFNLDFLGLNLSSVAIDKKGITFIVPILAALSAWIMAYAQNKMNVLQQEQSSISQWGMAIFTALLSLYLGAFVPAGVGLYWIAGNLLAIVVQWLLNIVMNPKKYVDYEDLEESKKELNALKNAGGNKISKEERRRVKEDYKKFFKIANKHLVFYSESNGFYKYFKGYIDYLLEYTNIPIHYITSDPNDNIFEMAKTVDQIKPYYIDSRTLITLMMKMDADVVVMTMPDLETYQIKRSYVKKDIEYVNVMHGVGSVNLTYRKGALDHFDTIFAADENQYEEIIKTEIAYDLPKKKVLKIGYPLLDEMIESYKTREKKNDEKTILIAPSWQKDNIVDSCLEDLLDNLKGHGYKVIVRPHPQHIRHMPEKMESLKNRYANDKDVEVQTDFSSNSTVFDADLLITDWSDIGFEYCFTTLRPVLYINTPMKVMNPEYQKIDTIPFNIKVRDIVGTQIEVSEIDTAIDHINEMFKNSDKYSKQIQNLLSSEVYNLGTSAKEGGRYLAQTVKEYIQNKK